MISNSFDESFLEQIRTQKNDEEVYTLKVEKDKLSFTILTLNEDNLKLKALVESLKQENEILNIESEYFNKIKKSDNIERDELKLNLEAEKRKNNDSLTDLHRNKCMLEKNHDIEDKHKIDMLKEENSNLSQKLLQYY